MALEHYRKKRDFRATPEPRGRVAPKKRQDLSFVIQKHAASHLHYDFRLEFDGVLLSWAVPKGPSLDPSDKRLAMQVEDHPLEYGSFEGTIPAKQYGGGTVLLWDRGIWIPKGDPATDYRKGHLKFDLVGEKLRGGWTLVRTQGSKYGGNGKQAWLLIKERDDFARNGRDAKVVDDEPDSVLSGRSLEQIAHDREHVWHSNRSVSANVQGGALNRRQADAVTAASASDPSTVAGAKKASLPATLSPQLATLVDACPSGDRWLHEVKYDGYRMVCRVDRGEVAVYSRNGKDWTAVMGAVAAAVRRLRIRSAWLDGEVVVMTPDGRTNFQRLQNALADPSVGALIYFIFDVPFLDGYDLRGATLAERKRFLRSILPDTDPVIRYGIEVQGSGDQFFAQACKLGLEGAVSKRVDSLYHAGARTRDWLKVKCGQRQEMVVGGFTDPQGSRAGFGALLLGVYEGDGTLRYSGRVGTGFDDATLASLRHTLDKLVETKPSFANPPRGYAAKGVHWVRPTLVAEVAFTEWTQDGTLRHPSFQGLRKDKKAEEVMREQAVKQSPVAAAASAAADASGRSTRKATRAPASAAPVVSGITLSHPDKLLFPTDRLSKLDLAQYYEKVSTQMIPHLRDRPLSLVRCPDGWQAQCFYQKHADKSINVAVDRITVPEGGGTATYLAANSGAAIVALLQWGVIEIHPWGARKPKLDRPDRLILDFDPDDGVDWPDLVSAVQVTRALLDDLGLKGFLKTTGGKGLHIVVPIRPTIEWDMEKGFAKAVADMLVSTFPDRFTATLSKAQRKGKIFIDYLRNGQGATAVAPYSVRAREHAPVATPIAWEELGQDVRFAYFNVGNVPARLGRLKRDPWAAFFEVRQSIAKPMMKRIGYKPG